MTEILQRLKSLYLKRETLWSELDCTMSAIRETKEAWYQANPIPKNKYWDFDPYKVGEPPLLRDSPENCTFIYHDSGECADEAAAFEHEEAYCERHANLKF